MRKIFPAFAAVCAGVVIAGCGDKTKMLAREFRTMDECIAFINSEIGPLKVITDKPGDISGRGDQKLFFRCEAQVTGTRGLFVEGRWAFPVFEKK